MNKPRVIKDYEKLSDEVREMIKLIYPMGFTEHLVSFVNKEGQRKMGLPFETHDYYYLIRMTPQKAEAIIEDDDDFIDGELKQDIKDEYADKYEEVDYLGEYNNNEDNDLFEGDIDDDF